MSHAEVLKDVLSGETPKHYGANFTKTIHATPSAAIDPSKVNLPEGYTVLITGAGKGIGEYIAKAYAQAKASNIIITSRTVKDLERVKQELENLAAGRSIRVSIFAGDASVSSSYEKLAGLIAKEHDGRLDCLVCNAGGGTNSNFTFDQKFHDTDPEDFTKNTVLNYLGPYYAARHLLPLMLKPQSVGRTVINITSGACHLVNLAPLWYNVSKLALNRLSEGIALEYAADGLLAIAVHPGGVVTPGATKVIPSAETILKDDIRLCGAVCVWISNVKPIWMSGRYMDSRWDVDELSAKKDEIVQDDKLKFRMVI